MNRRFLLISLILFFLAPALASAQKIQVSGSVKDKQTGDPVEFATVTLEGNVLWAVTDEKGAFTIRNVGTGKHTITVACLGYVTYSKEVTLSASIDNFKVLLSQDNLSIEGATVTAKEDANSTTTARTIDKTALDHVQILNVGDIAGLLPGGATSNPSLLGTNNFALRSGGAGEAGNAYFGTAVEVDGVRLSNNGSFGGADLTSTQLRGASTNNIASSNVESIEVISGVASVEYGDMSSGVVKINTRRGKTPLTVTMSTTPNNKQLSVSKGLALKGASGRSAGIINASGELTRSISEPMSPFNSYLREQASVTWSHTLTSGIFSDTPLKVSVGATGNLGGLDNLADPDTYKDSYTRSRDNALRGNVSLNWLLNKSWITNLEFNGSVSWSDKGSESKTYYSSTTSTNALHGIEEGYFMSEVYREGSGQHIVQLAPNSSWSNIMCYDDKPLYFKATLKANWAHRFGEVSNKVKIGADFSGDKNFGVGQYSPELASAPSYREYRYCDVPWMYNAAAYAENTINASIGKTSLMVVAGIRNDNTIIPGSDYGVTSSFSPRVSAKYTVLDSKFRRNKVLRNLGFKAAWGKSVKLPSFSILYPAPTYYDTEVFRSTVAADNTVSSVFYTIPHTLVFNENLRFQQNNQTDLGMFFDIAGVKVDLSAYYTLTRWSYRLISDYEKFTYASTPLTSVQGCAIPAEDRLYTVDKATGIVTVNDRTGKLDPVQAAYQMKDQFVSTTMASNDSNPIRRYGLEWSVEFPRIKSINTTFKMDGNFYGYRSVLTDKKAECPASSVASDGSFFKYVAYFYGADQHSNGSSTASVRNNITMITQIPQVRMIFSVKLETSLLKYSQALSERLDGGYRSHILADKGKILEYTDGEFYGREGYYVVFPDTYVSIDEPGVHKDFLTALKWAKDNDMAMYADLSRLVKVTNYNYTFKKDFISPYFNVNFSVTKEIGDVASISFYANNFFNNMGQVHSTKTDNWSSVSTYIPRFYYGLTLRLKF